ncbi:hypothetical protein L6452_35077 [Arctium lappa]|uniref:Uncharacterized protein n=1 Tax=Arctium lappa TaxID=4217 RepID=A0ACB8YL15_ARCLA|nr:hypothetical protein L6452_35077 [Arctium lappa]
MEDRDLLPPSLARWNPTRILENLPPRKTHWQSISDISFGFSTILRSSPPLIPLRGSKGLDGSASLRNNPGSKPLQYVKWESSWEKTIAESNAKGMEERKFEDYGSWVSNQLIPQTGEVFLFIYSGRGRQPHSACASRAIGAAIVRISFSSSKPCFLRKALPRSDFDLLARTTSFLREEILKMSDTFGFPISRFQDDDSSFLPAPKN